MEPSEKKNWGILAAVGAGLLASACCTIPLLLVALGVGGAWVSTFTAFEPFRPWFIALAVAFLGYAGYREYRTSTGPECDCEVTMQDKLRRTLLVVGAIITAGLIASPWIIGGTTAAIASDSAVPDYGRLEQVALEVDGMTCAACNATVRKALTNLEGVKDAVVTFEPPLAVVTYDPDRVTIEQMTEATSNVGYPSRLKIEHEETHRQ